MKRIFRDFNLDLSMVTSRQDGFTRWLLWQHDPTQEVYCQGTEGYPLEMTGPNFLLRNHHASPLKHKLPDWREESVGIVG